MESDNLKYTFENLINEESFRSWVINNDAKSATFWHSVLVSNPKHEKIFQLAKNFLLALSPPTKDVKKSELKSIFDKIIEQSNTLSLK